MKFETNIKCDVCVAKVSPFLDELVGEGKWKVDLSSPKRTLSINNLHISEGEIKAKLEAIGYEAKEAEED